MFFRRLAAQLTTSGFYSLYIYYSCLSANWLSPISTFLLGLLCRLLLFRLFALTSALTNYCLDCCLGCCSVCCLECCLGCCLDCCLGHFSGCCLNCVASTVAQTIAQVITWTVPQDFLGSFLGCCLSICLFFIHLMSVLSVFESSWRLKALFSLVNQRNQISTFH